MNLIKFVKFNYDSVLPPPPTNIAPGKRISPVIFFAVFIIYFTFLTYNMKESQVFIKILINLDK